MVFELVDLLMVAVILDLLQAANMSNINMLVDVS